ncbi:MAG: DUF998 domain-containing protein [Saprospiraceae bacterium]|nr:DUF998 domain-containing protein [Saprospiraceae bacterium]
MREKKRISRIAAIIGLVSMVTHLLSFSFLHYLEPQLNPATSLISDYTQTPGAWLASLSFIFFATGWASLSIALSDVSGSRFVAIGQLLFFLAFISILAGTVFPSSMDPRTGTVLSKIQNLLARPGLFIGILLISKGLSKKAEWRTVASTLLFLSIFALILLGLTIGILIPKDLGGIGQRLVFLLLYIWIWLVASHLLHLPSAKKRT